MLKYGVSITDSEDVAKASAITMRGELPYLLERVKALGFDAAEINVADPTKYNMQELRRNLSDNGLVCCAALTGLSLKGDRNLVTADHKNRQAAVDMLKRYIDFCKELNAITIVGTYRTYIPFTDDPKPYVDNYREGVIKLAEYAQDVGVTIVLEAVNMYYTNFLNSAREMTRFVKELNMSSVKLHIDSSHMILHDVDVHSRIMECGTDLKYVHFSDSDRYACGTGNINFNEYIRGLYDLGYDGYNTIEVVPYPDQERAPEFSLRYLKMLEESYSLRYLEKPTPDFPRAFFD
ncbi:MAG: sugar phosphate isomerase/epimerase [Clostridia bacterium]|nr:sugar phosphate isomerase/epimerase [Clostridia bacterium]